MKLNIIILFISKNYAHKRKVEIIKFIQLSIVIKNIIISLNNTFNNMYLKPGIYNF